MRVGKKNSAQSRDTVGTVTPIVVLHPNGTHPQTLGVVVITAHIVLHCVFCLLVVHGAVGRWQCMTGLTLEWLEGPTWSVGSRERGGGFWSGWRGYESCLRRMGRVAG